MPSANLSSKRQVFIELSLTLLLESAAMNLDRTLGKYVDDVEWND